MVNRRTFLAASSAVSAGTLLAACGLAKPPIHKPKTPTIGPDLSGANTTVRAQDDLFRHVNGKWLRETVIPADKAGINTFSDLDDNAEKNLRTIIEAIPADTSDADEKKIRDLYASFMDADAINKAGIQPISAQLSAIADAKTKSDLAAVMGKNSIVGGNSLIGLYVGADQEDSTQYIVTLTQSGIGLPDEAYYREEEHATTRAQYLTYLTTLAKLAKLNSPNELAEKVLAFETLIAAGHWDNVRSRDSKETYNRFDWKKLKSQAPGIEWDSWLESVHDKKTDFTEVVVGQPSYFTEVAALWSRTELAELKDYLTLTTISGYSSALSKEFADAHFNFYKRDLKGTKKQLDRWKLAVGYVDSMLGEALGKKYVAQHFSVEAKNQVQELVDNLIAAYRTSFTTLDWMTAETKKNAIAKLEKIVVKIGYPETWRDYSQLPITANFMENTFAAMLFEHRRQLNKLGTKVVKTEWQMTPQTVNAYYDPSINEICFPAAILQAPFFSPDATDAVNYGGIGGVIGHEIGHGFDDQGATYDGEGNLRNWWTAADTAAFNKKTTAMKAQYEGLVPRGMKPSQKVDGALTVGENLADLGGIAIALAAYKAAATKKGKPAEITDFFYSWARIWRGKIRPERAATLLATDPHSPNEFRCNRIVSNIDDFYTTFDVKPGDKEYLPPHKRIHIW